MRNIYSIIYIVFMSLLLTSCESNLDVKVKRYIDNNCICSVSVCQCLDTYNKENVIYINCTDVDVSSFSDIIRNCDYWDEIDGWHWERKNKNVNESYTESQQVV